MKILTEKITICQMVMFEVGPTAKIFYMVFNPFI